MKSRILKNGVSAEKTRLTRNNFDNINFACSDEVRKTLDFIRAYTFRTWENYCELELDSWTYPIDLVMEAMKNAFFSEPSCFENFGFYQNGVSPLLKVNHRENSYAIEKHLRINGNSEDIKINSLEMKGSERKWVYIRNKKKFAKLDENFITNIDLFLRIPDTLINIENIPALVTDYIPKLSGICLVDMPENYEIREMEGVKCSPVIYLKNNEYPFCIDLQFRYNSHEVFMNNKKEILYWEDMHNKNGGKNTCTICKINRDKEVENLYIEELSKNAVRKNNLFIPKIEPLSWLTGVSKELIAKGFEIYGENELVNFKIRKNAPQLRVDVSSGIDWFDLSTDIDFDGIGVSFEELKNSIQKNNKFIKLSDGTIGIIPEKWIKKLSGIIGLLDAKKNSVRAAKFHIPLVESLLELSNSQKTDRQFEEIKRKFSNFKKIKEISLPVGLNAELRDYQKASLHWFYFLKEFSFGGCLADDMGLGKTLQAITLLLKEKEQGNKKCSIVIVPTSLVFNWEKEVEKFAPQLRLKIHHGQDREKIKDLAGTDILITTYGVLRRDIGNLKKLDFNYIILDESQNIKNPLSKNASCALQLRGDSKLILSGTPIENNTMELWSQFFFLNPGLLGNMSYFKSAFSKGIEAEKDRDKMESLKNMINPFILRRTKEIVAKERPEKQERVLYCDMDDKQREVYSNWKDYFRLEIKNAIANEGKFKAKAKVLKGLIKLRQICNHPKMIDYKYKHNSGKFELIKDKINEAVESGHKILVFSSFVKMLSIYRKYFDAKKIKYAYLDGATRKREEEIKKFQNNPDIKIFLISLKAGGLGLNLTSADYVIITDPWWNPAAEMQAIDRAHRIGQDKKVFILKFITKDTIEEKILKLQESKKDIVRNIITTEESIFKQLSPEMLQDLFS